MKLNKILDAIKDELKKPLPEPRIITAKKRRKKMAKKAAQVEDVEDEDEDIDETEDEGDEDEGDDEEDEAPKAKSKSKKAAKPAKAAKGKGAKKASKSNGGDEGFVTLQDLAAEAEIEPQSARVKLRDSDLEKPEGGRWRWKEGSKDLKAARKALGL